jgi:hypothetical protein
MRSAFEVFGKKSLSEVINCLAEKDKRLKRIQKSCKNISNYAET